jgi:hypothetical protein
MISTPNPSTKKYREQIRDDISGIANHNPISL